MEAAIRVAQETLQVEDVRLLGPTEPPPPMARTVAIHAPENSQPYGVLAAMPKRPFTANDLSFLEAVANVIAAAIARARIEEQLRLAERRTEGRLDLWLEEFDLAVLVRQVADDFREPAAQARAPLKLQLPEKAEGSWDRLRIEQVLVNVLSNAVKYGRSARAARDRRSLLRARRLVAAAEGGLATIAFRLYRS